MRAELILRLAIYVLSPFNSLIPDTRQLQKPSLMLFILSIE